MNTSLSSPRLEEENRQLPFTVSELSSKIKNVLQKNFSSVVVKGEISNLKEQVSGHIYFTLKDKEAQIGVALFKNSRFILDTPLKEGEEVIVYGEISLYPPRGQYQLIVRNLKRSGSLGDLLKKWHDLRLKLEALGWFSSEKKKPIPKIPSVIGVITSQTGSVIQDIIQILKRRFPGFHLRLYPVTVQGDRAAQEMICALEEMTQYRLADVIILCRGGGSVEDLAPFNEESLAQAIHLCPIPIISAVGHQTDFTIADFVSDLRAPTPSAAAELVIVEKAAIRSSLSHMESKITKALATSLAISRQKMISWKMHPFFKYPDRLLNPFQQRLDLNIQQWLASLPSRCQEYRLYIDQLKKQRESLEPRRQLLFLKKQLSFLRDELQKKILQVLQHKKKDLLGLQTPLGVLHPKELLKKGYSIVFREKGSSVILSSREVSPGDDVKIVLFDGTVSATVKEQSNDTSA